MDLGNITCSLLHWNRFCNYYKSPRKQTGSSHSSNSTSKDQHDRWHSRRTYQTSQLKDTEKAEVCPFWREVLVYFAWEGLESADADEICTSIPPNIVERIEPRCNRRNCLSNQEYEENLGVRWLTVTKMELSWWDQQLSCGAVRMKHTRPMSRPARQRPKIIRPSRLPVTYPEPWSTSSVDRLGIVFSGSEELPSEWDMSGTAWLTGNID